MRQWDRLQHLPSNKLWKTDVNKEAKEIEIPKEKLNVIRYTSESYFSILKHATYEILNSVQSGRLSVGGLKLKIIF